MAHDHERLERTIISRHGPRYRMVVSWLLLILIAGTGCISRRPLYPALGYGQPYCLLTIDNQSDVSRLRALDVTVTLDGFSVADPESHWTDLALPATAIYGTPLGKATIRIPPGGHGIELDLSPKATYTWEPISFTFETRVGTNYAIRLLPHPGRFNTWGLKIEYDGWSDEERSRFPSEYVNGS